MNRDDVIRMAREAGGLPDPMVFIGAYERFAALIEQATIERCAEVCDENERANLYGVKECAAAIRALKEQA